MCFIVDPSVASLVAVEKCQNARDAPVGLAVGKSSRHAPAHQSSLAMSDDATNDTHASSTLSSSTKLHVAVGSTVAVIGATLALTAPFVVLKTPLPYMATPGHKIKRALQSLPTKKGTFVDLGSGDGEAVYQAYRAGFEQVVGYELNWTLWGISQMRRLVFWGPQARRTTRIYCKDLFASALPSDTTAVMVFGVTPLMKQLSVKLANETRPGVHVLSYRFPIPLYDDSSDAETSQNLLRAKLVYDYEEMRVYKVIDEKDEERNEVC
jgi:hypothetical protein